MAVPTIDDLTAALGTYTNTKPSANEFVKKSVQEAVDYLGTRFPTVPAAEVDDDGYIVPTVLPAGVTASMYEGEIIRLGADLFWRRQAQNGVVGVNAMDGAAIRVAADPFASSDKRTQRWGGLGVG